MRKYIIIFLLLAISSVSQAAWHSINYDALTVAAMGTAYEKQNVVEQKAATAVDSVFRHYTRSNVAMAGIMVTKAMEHKNLSNVKYFSDEEFMYYTQIKNLVSNQIMPNIINVSYQFIQHPDNILYWGPYLYKTTNNVENLCKQFETLVTNSKLSFKDIVFYTVNERFKDYFDLLKMGKNVDWAQLFDRLGDFGKDLSFDQIKEDFSHLKNTIANIGMGAFDKGLEDATTIGKVFKSSPKEIMKMYSQFKDIYDNYKEASDAESLAKSLLNASDPNWMNNLFDVSDYNINNYMSSYVKELQGTYYTQVYYIKRIDEGKKVIAQFTPKKGQPGAIYSKKVAPSGWGSEWLQNSGYHYKGKGPSSQGEINSTSDYPHVKKSNIEILNYVRDYAGYGQSFVDSYKASNPGKHNISISSTLYHEDRVNYLGHPGNHNRNDRYCFKSYAFTITDSWSNDTILYEEMFDSKTMDLDTFKKSLERRKQGYEELQQDEADAGHDNPYKYVIVCDPKREYTEADQSSVKGKASVTFIAHCGNSNELGSGTFSWKVNSKKQKDRLSDVSIDLAMGAADQVSDDDLNQLTQRESELQSQIDDLKKQETELDNQLQKLASKILQYRQTGNTAMVNTLMDDYERLSAQKDDVVAQREDAEAELQKNNEAIQSYYEDMMDTADDSPLRINSNMEQLQALYQIQWNDDESWQKNEAEYVFTCTGYSRSGKFPVTYEAKLTLQRKPQYFLGIRIHRPILQVEYKLTSDQASSSVIEVMELDSNMSDKAKAEKINNRLDELKKDFPNCSIELDYQAARTDIVDEDEDQIHLLLPSERLEVARSILDRLMWINNDLVNIYHHMQYRKTIKQWFTKIWLDLTDRGARGDIASVAFANWKAAARTAKQKQSSSYNPNKDENKEDEVTSDKKE